MTRETGDRSARHGHSPRRSDAVIFDNTPSSSGVIARSGLARITRSHNGSNFFHPAA
ncbi:MAG TPA: hypothetical protein VI485_30920 [Vicinamibacterales bacterium]|nr:hypothetical protein [Vicinamibacterales bacterium]